MNVKGPTVAERFQEYFETIKGRLHSAESCVKVPCCPVYVHEKLTRKISKYDVSKIGQKSFIGPQTKASQIYTEASSSKPTKPKPSGVSEVIKKCLLLTDLLQFKYPPETTVDQVFSSDEQSDDEMDVDVTDQDIDEITALMSKVDKTKTAINPFWTKESLRAKARDIGEAIEDGIARKNYLSLLKQLKDNCWHDDIPFDEFDQVVFELYKKSFTVPKNKK